LLRCAEAEGTELTGGPGWQRRGEGQRAAESGRWRVGWAGALRGWAGREKGRREWAAGSVGLVD